MKLDRGRGRERESRNSPVVHCRMSCRLQCGYYSVYIIVHHVLSFSFVDWEVRRQEIHLVNTPGEY